MKTFEITKEQILELINCSNQIKVDYRLKEWFPQAFESELKVGKWYKMNEYLFNYQGVEKNDICGYGFDFKPFPNNGVEYFEKCRIFCVGEKYIVEKTTDKEVETALEKELNKKLNNKTFREVSFIDPISNVKYKIEGNFRYFDNKGNWCHLGNVILSKDGKWAEIISEPIELTLEQIAEKFNVNVEQLKIKK